MTLCAVALLAALVGLYGLQGLLARIVSVLGVLVALGTATLACAGAIVLMRLRRTTIGAEDLFLALNRSREAAAIAAALPPRVTAARRWLARWLLGHDLIVGDWVEVRPWHEIRATLDAQGCLEQLPFLPEMVAMCGRRARVFRGIHRLFDYRKTRRMRHMHGTVLLVGAVCDGSGHGGCEAACHTVWKAAWLRRVDGREPTQHAVGLPAAPPDVVGLEFGTLGPLYVCQLTQLHAASRPIGSWNAVDFFRPLAAGNVAPTAFVVGWLTHLFNELQHHRGGVSFPTFESAVPDSAPPEERPLSAGDQVMVKASGEIRATLNDQMLHRGLWFEPDMLKHCGHCYPVQREVRKVIDIVTGEMRTMKTPAYLLRDVHFSGERQLFNAQCEPLFWRAAWLRRVD